MAFRSFRHKLILVSPLTPLLYSDISSTVTQRANYTFVFAISYSCRHQHKWITATQVLQLALPAYLLIWLHPVGRDCTQLGADIRRPILSNYLFQGLLWFLFPSTLVNPFLSQRCRALINPYTPIWSSSLKCVVQEAPSISTDILPSELGVAVHCTDVLCESFQFLCFDFPPSHTYL